MLAPEPAQPLTLAPAKVRAELAPLLVQAQLPAQLLAQPPGLPLAPAKDRPPAGLTPGPAWRLLIPWVRRN